MAHLFQPEATIDGRFVLDSEQKRGGMGTIWRARDLQGQQVVALKILHEAGGDGSERFLREADLLAALCLPGLVAHVAHGTALGVPYLAMEWLEGETLAERLARQPLTAAESLALAEGTAGVLQALHSRGIVHRDIKPSNLFLRRQRIDEVVLLDLGIARQLDDHSDLTRTGSILGTPSYMAPEQAQGQRELTPASDVFSLGCVLFECLTGHLPFIGSHVFSVLAKVLFEEPLRLRELRPELPAALETLVADMLIKDPTRRPRDAGAVLEALAGIDGDVVDPPVGQPRTQTIELPALAAEHQLVSVILATGGARAASELDEEGVAAFGGECKRLADGTAVITLGQQGGAATDLAARAARCALGLQQVRPDGAFVVATGRGIPRARVHIGQAVDRAGSILRTLAGRASGAIWLDEVTAGLLGARFATTRVEADGGDGADGALFVLTGEDPSIDPGRRLLGRPTTCVGREHELGMLDLALRACIEESTPRAVLVVGPAGIGKSRLRHELLRRTELHGQPPTVLLGLGDPVRIAGARGLLGGALGRLCNLRPEAGAEQNRAALEVRIGQPLAPGAERLRTVVFLGELCGVPYPADTLVELRAARQSPAIMADLVTQAWVTFVRAETARAPMLLVLDDLQWSDAGTIALVAAVLRSLPSSPFMVLALGRPEVNEQFPDLWKPRLTTLPLQPLGRAATARLIRQALGDQVGDDSTERMVEQAGGNALYLEELIRAAEAHRDAVPGTVLAMLQARIGLLAAGPRRVLRAASVFGEHFPVSGVEALLQAAGAGDDLQPALATLDRNEILEQQVDERGPGRWRFRHALMRDAAYALCTADELKAFHVLAARALESIAEDPAVIASHLERGSQPQAAVRYFCVAADQAYSRHDLQAAVSLVERGVACGAAGEQLGVLRSIEASARFFRSEFEAGHAASTQALALLPSDHARRAFSLSSSIYMGMQLGRGIEVARHVEQLVAIDPAPDQRANYVRALGDVIISHVVLGKRGEAQRLLDRAQAVDGPGENPLTHGHTLYWKLRAQQMLGEDPHATLSATREAVVCYQRSGDRRMLAYAQVELGECTRRMSSVSEGAAIMRQALALAHELREATTTSFVGQYLANLLAERGQPEDLAEARTVAHESVELGGGVYAAFGLMALARAEVHAGNLDAAESYARKAQDEFQKIGLVSYFPHTNATLLQVMLSQGDGPAAVELADRTLHQLDHEGPFGIIELSVRLVAARAHLLAGRRGDARAGLGRALAVLDRRAASFADAGERERFYTGVPEHVALTALGRELGLSPAGPST